MELIIIFSKNAIPQPIWSSAVVIPKKVFDEIGGFPIGEAHTEDLDTWFRIGIKYPIAWNGEELATYHMDADNRTYGIKPMTNEPAFCRTVRNAIKMGIVPDDQIDDVKEYVAFWKYHFIKRLIYSNNQSVGSGVNY